MMSQATFSKHPDRRYRYRLLRIWNPGGNRILPIVGLNPSDADEIDDDPTIRRCIGFAKSLGMEGFVMVNLFGRVSPSPKSLFDPGDSVGPENDHHLKEVLAEAECVWVCWGASRKPQLGREAFIQSLVKRAICLGTTKAGHPRHPLYLPYNTPFEEYSWPAFRGDG